jgi:hypothetical protein
MEKCQQCTSYLLYEFAYKGSFILLDSRWNIPFCGIGAELKKSTANWHCKYTVPTIGKKLFPARLQSNFYIHPVSDLYIPTIGLPIWLQENMWTDPGNKQYKSLTDT